MTKLLVSVRSLAEARLALAAGVDLIDLKEPARGSLGALDPAVARQIVRSLR
ncbi:MAG: (5-formylfuran-3-yl)methyl phosphate synthase, partial [Pirellulales bacterium]